MTAGRTQLPQIEWPERYGPEDGGSIVDAIVAAFRDCCQMELLTPGTTLILAPDPPLPDAPTVPGAIGPDGEGGAPLSRISWGHRGQAYLATEVAQFTGWIAALLAMRSTTLSIIAVPPGGPTIDEEQAGRLISAFLTNEPDPERLLPYAGLFFDMGVLVQAEPLG